ncbi:MAG: DUF4282 domain-containing protein [Pseudomonadota bacterium]
MSDLVSRFLSFQEHMGRGLVRLVYYVLVFLLVVTTLYEMTTSFGAMTETFWSNMWRVLVIIPLMFFVKLLLLRLAAELVLAVQSINESLQSGTPQGDVMSSGLNLGGHSPAAPASEHPADAQAETAPEADAAPAPTQDADQPEANT